MSKVIKADFLKAATPSKSNSSMMNYFDDTQIFAFTKELHNRILSGEISQVTFNDPRMIEDSELSYSRAKSWDLTPLGKVVERANLIGRVNELELRDLELTEEAKQICTKFGIDFADFE